MHHLTRSEREIYRKDRIELMKREMSVLADEIANGRRHIRNCDVAMILIALRKYDPK